MHEPGNLALPVFGIDDPDAGRCDGEVVDVSAAGGHAAVVQRDDPIGVGAHRHRVSDCRFGNGAMVEGRFMLRCAPEGDKQPADAGTSLPRALLAVAPATLVLAHQARPRISQLQRHLSRRWRSGLRCPGMCCRLRCAPPGPTSRLPRRPVRDTRDACVVSKDLELAGRHIRKIGC